MKRDKDPDYISEGEISIAILSTTLFQMFCNHNTHDVNEHHSAPDKSSTSKQLVM